MLSKVKQLNSNSTSNVNSINCPKATSPVNISMDSIMGPCVLKCDYNYNYNVYSPNVTNKQAYLSLNYSGKYNPVTYNDEKYNVQEIRVYQPSLHQYKGTNADGEILIIHNGPGKNLIVSVPFMVGGKTDKGSSQLANMITESASRIPSVDESVTLSMGDFNLSNFIPQSKGYFSYTGTLPYDPCNGSYNYIVYAVDNALNIPNDVLEKLKQITDNTECKINENNVFYNKNGANSKNSNDDIFIDCQPVDSGGNILVDMNMADGNSSSSESDNIGIDFEKLAPYLYTLLGLAVGYIIYYLAMYLFENTSSSSPPGPSS
tara:strand:- start:9095 stop:10048 length:954 start_codon:yes stop_codon:yes gene_type:complete